MPIFASIGARVLHAFAPILRSAAEDFERFHDGALFVYPHPEGALCIATDGVVLAAYLDRGGRTNQPAQFQVPERFFAACAPPTPTLGFYQGWSEPLPVPEWTCPAQAILFAFGAFVSPAMPHPVDAEDPESSHCLFSMSAAHEKTHRDTDFRAQSPRFDPRAVLTKLGPRSGAGSMCISIAAAARFLGCFDVFGQRGAAFLSRHGDGAPVSILFHACPDFIGLISPMTGADTPKPPAFMAGLAPEPATDASTDPLRDAA